MSVVIAGFTRPETIALTGLNFDRLLYLEKKGWVVPTKLGKTKRPPVIYSWTQLIQLMVIKSCKFALENERLKGLLDAIAREESTTLLKSQDGYFLTVSVLDKVKDTYVPTLTVFIDEDKNLPDLLKKTRGIELENNTIADLKVLPPMRVFIEEMYANAEESPEIDVDDFKQRLEVFKG